eukprot:CAMPEP_0197033328 /NCGR_PEP_ID=MMETSP1384-20130603/11767_1 /TAXON_ID=29189 /ORGANISM="Ammonia sp." /LENGTH=502 /DNA_ID=CAMNT_0042463123 /DNA_START=28 /DNA_END=1536 /DNA_ORIENTATION=+
MSAQQTYGMILILVAFSVAVTNGLVQDHELDASTSYVWNCTEPVCHLNCSIANSRYCSYEGVIYCLDGRNCTIDATDPTNQYSVFFGGTVYANTSNVLTIHGCMIAAKIYVQNASTANVIFDGLCDAGEGSVTVMANYTQYLNAQCLEDQCDRLTIHADHAHRVDFACGGEFPEGGCPSTRIFANHVHDLSITAVNLSAMIDGYVYAANAQNIAVECRMDYVDVNRYGPGACGYTYFDFSNAASVNFTCTSPRSCYSYNYHAVNNSVINVSNASNVHFQASNVYPIWNPFIFGEQVFYVLDARYTQNMHVQITKNNATDLPLDTASNFAIYASMLNTTSIRCNGIDACGALKVYSPNGLATVDMAFTPNCSRCADAMNGYGCFGNTSNMTLLCGARYDEQCTFAPDPNMSNASTSVSALCSGVCCEKSKYYVNTSRVQNECNERPPDGSSGGHNYTVYYVIAGVAAFCVCIGLCIAMVIIARRRKTGNKEKRFSVNDALLQK